MGRLGISAEEVHHAILKLQSIPRNISVDNIREVLGTGSKSTIARFLREWKANNGIASRELLAVPAELAAAVTGLWHQLQEMAAKDILAYEEAAQRDIQAAQQRYDDEQRQRLEAEHRCHVLEASLSQQQEDHQQLQKIHQQQHVEKERLLERIQSLNANATQQDAEQARLHQLLKHMQHNLEHYQNAIVAQREEQTLLLEKQRHEAELVRRELQQQLVQAREQSSQAALRCEGLQQQNAALEQQLAQQQIQLHENSQHYQALQLTHHTMQHVYQQLQAQHDMQLGQLNASLQRVNTLEQQIAVISHQLQHAEQRVAQMTHQCEQLQQDNKLLLQQKAQIEGQLQFAQRQRAALES